MAPSARWLRGFSSSSLPSSPSEDEVSPAVRRAARCAERRSTVERDLAESVAGQDGGGSKGAPTWDQRRGRSADRFAGQLQPLCGGELTSAGTPRAAHQPLLEPLYPPQVLLLEPLSLGGEFLPQLLSEVVLGDLCGHRRRPWCEFWRNLPEGASSLQRLVPAERGRQVHSERFLSTYLVPDALIPLPLELQNSCEKGLFSAAARVPIFFLRICPNNNLLWIFLLVRRGRSVFRHYRTARASDCSTVSGMNVSWCS